MSIYPGGRASHGALSFVLAVCAACSSTADARPERPADVQAALAAPASRSSTPTAAVCRLSRSEKRKAVRAFQELMPVFNHPRCANCHGGIDVFAESAEQLHGGGRIAADDERKCGMCHETPNWQKAPSREFGVFSAGMTSAEICETIKGRNTPEHFLGHLHDDALIGAAFEGRRGQSTLEPAPPPMTREAFEAKAAAWIKALTVKPPNDAAEFRHPDEDWPEPPSCGCTATDTGYRIVYRQRYQSEKRGVGWDVTYRAELAPDTSEDARDQLVGEGRYQGVVTLFSANCANPDKPPQHIQVSGTLEASGDVLEDPTSSKRPKGRLMSFTLATTDWKILPLLGVVDTPEAQEAAKGAGTVGKFFLQLSGPVTQHEEKKVVRNTTCDGPVTRSVDITVEERALSAPRKAPRR